MGFLGIFGSNKKYKQQLALQEQQLAAAKAAQQAEWDRQDQQAAAAKAEAAAQLEAATAAATAKRQTALTGATATARTSADDIIRQWGLDPTAYADRVSGAISSRAAALGDTGDPYSLNGEQIASQLLNSDQTMQRNNLTRQANEKFGLNYGDNLIDDHLLDGTINEILGTQQGDAQSYLDRGKARGIYNDTGYGAGQNRLASQASAGRSQLGSLAGNVIDGYEAKGDLVRDKAYAAAGNATLGQTINLDDYLGQGAKVAESANNYAAGDLRTAVGGQQFFDFSGLTNAAGAAQGAGNFRDSSITGALAERNKQRAAARGLGSQGAF